jgi:autotransporter-associated beta strand protein
VICEIVAHHRKVPTFPDYFRNASQKASSALVALLLLAMITPVSGQQLRVLGIDVSTYQGDLTTANWTTLKTTDSRDFVIVRSSRGGTTGEDHRQGGYPSGNNTQYYFSQRYDDPYYVQNINRATAAGLFAGTYHFARPDVLSTTTGSDGVPAGVDNSGTDEADHMLQMASAFMRPGYLPPVLDLEAGDGIRSDNSMAQFCIDFSDRIYSVMGIRPAIYINGNYAAFVIATATTPAPAQVVAAIPTLWSARWPNQTNVPAIDVQNGEPKDSYTPIYGPWDDAPNPTHPWKFWQYASTARLTGYKNGTANIDVDVARGGMEFLKDQLIPAIWVTNVDGLWTTLQNWNSGITPVAPAPGPGQLTPVGTNLPTPRLPANNDTVVLDHPSANVTVTLSSGTHNIRKLYMRETLNITGGSLTVNYVPSWDSTTNGAQFSGPVTMSGSASLSVHTLQVDATRTFTVNGGTLAFNTITLMPNASPGKLAVGGDVAISAVVGTSASITNGTGGGTAGFLDMLAGTRAISVASGVDLFVPVLVSNGGLNKTGAGTLRLLNANNYSGGTTVSAGTLLVVNTSGSGTGSGAVTVNGGVVAGTGTVSGLMTLNSGGTLSPGVGAAFGTFTLNTAPVFNGTNLIKINRNGGTPLTDRVSLTSGTLNYGGTLVVSNAGAALIGGETFTCFLAPAFSGAFAATKLATLATNLNWYLGDLTTLGRIKVNRSPVPSTLSVTNTPMTQIQIPIASLTAGATDADGDSVTLGGISLTTTNSVPLTTNGGFITYLSSGNAPDQINYTINDGHGGVANGRVTIAPSTTGQFLGLPATSGGSVSFRFAGGPSLTYYVERSTELPLWVTILTNVMPAAGVFDFTDDFHDLAGPPSSAFYRLRWSP